MLNSQILEVAIGVVFVFLIASLLATAVREMLEGLLKTRAIHLERGIRQLLNDPDGTGATKAIFDHPQLYGLFDGVYDPAKLTAFRKRVFLVGGRRQTQTLKNGAVQTSDAKRLPLFSKFPSYIPSRNFALALLDLIGAGGGDQRASGGALMETLRANAMALRPGKVRDAVLVALSEAGNDFDRARTSLEAWFDSGMDRVSGWYKRESQVLLLLIGLATAVVFNIDAVHVTRELASSNSVRQQLLLQATDVQAKVAQHQAATGEVGLADEALVTAKTGLGDLLGWQKPGRWDFSWVGILNGLYILLGWVITGIAISLGAPFWFDMLNKIMVIRATVKPYEKSPTEGSDDRRGAEPPAERLEPATPAAAAPRTPVIISVQPEGAILGHIRLAVDLSNVATPVLSIDGAPQQVPADGFVECALEVGVPHRLLLTGADAEGVARTWQQTVTLGDEDDLLPISATLQ